MDCAPTMQGTVPECPLGGVAFTGCQPDACARYPNPGRGISTADVEFNQHAGPMATDDPDNRDALPTELEARAKIQ